MPDSKLKVMTATAQLKMDHRKVKELLSKYEKLGEKATGSRTSLFEEIKKELEIHAQIEEEIFYPGVEQAKAEESEDIVAEAREEHQIVKTLLKEMSALEAGDTQFEAKMKVLKESVLHHAGEEEKEMFPLFSKLSSEEQDTLSAALRERKNALAGREDQD